jgi:membrane-bound serine protease (ClpP class)
VPHKIVKAVASLLLLAVAWCGALPSATAQEERGDPPVVYVVPIEGVIDLGLAPFVRRVLDQATAEGAAAVVLEVNTFGGRVDAAVQIRDALLDARIRTIAYVNKRAISAGALISLAAEHLVMSGGSTIGAATPVQAGGPGGGAQPVEEKTVSYVRKEFRATAEARKRPPRLAEAMVDSDIAIRGVIEKGKLLTMTTDEALKHKLIDFRADTLDAALARLDLKGVEIRHASLNWAEQVVRFLTHPVVSSLLITIAMLGIIIELRTPGFGIAGIFGVGSLAAFFWGHWLVQLAGWEELILVLAGLVLLVVEIFVMPGFGIAGVLGILAVVSGLILSLMGAGDTPEFMMRTAARVVSSLLVAIVLSLVILRFLPRLPVGRQLILDTGLSADKGYASAPETDRGLLGKRGRAASALHPAGIADIGGERIDVVSTGDMIDPEEIIEVVRVDGNRIVVRRPVKINNEEE